MGSLRHTAASVVAASAVLLTGQAGVASADTALASQGPRQGFRAAADVAADAYREDRRSILRAYRKETGAAQQALQARLLDARTAKERRSAFRAYVDATAEQQARAHAQMQVARQKFRTTVVAARDQFGVGLSAG